MPQVQVIARFTAAFVHRSVRPVSVEGQHRDGVGHAPNPFPGGGGNGKYVALHICSVHIMLIQGFLLGLCQGHGHGHVCLPTGRQGHGATVQAFQKQVSVIGGHVSAAVQVSVVQSENFLPVAGDVIQQSLGVIPVHGSIAVKVHVDEAVVRFHGFAVHGPGDVRIQSGCGLTQVPGRFKFFAIFLQPLFAL